MKIFVNQGRFYEKKIEKKSHNAKKTERGEPPFEIFQHPFCRKTQKKLKSDLFGKIFSEEVSKCRNKTERETLWSRPVLYVMQETFLVQFRGPTGTICRLLKIL